MCDTDDFGLSNMFERMKAKKRMKELQRLSGNMSKYNRENNFPEHAELVNLHDLFRKRPSYTVVKWRKYENYGNGSPVPNPYRYYIAYLLKDSIYYKCTSHSNFICVSDSVKIQALKSEIADSQY